MLTHSLFSITCICGEQLRSEGKTGICPTCQREFVIEWPAEYESEEQTKEAAGAAFRSGLSERAPPAKRRKRRSGGGIAIAALPSASKFLGEFTYVQSMDCSDRGVVLFV